MLRIPTLLLYFSEMALLFALAVLELSFVDQVVYITLLVILLPLRPRYCTIILDFWIYFLKQKTPAFEDAMTN